MDYKETYLNSIFQESQCLQRESNIVFLLRKMLEDHGFQAQKYHSDIYYRDDQRAILSIVDDVEHTNYQHHRDFWQSISRRDIIITDNFITSSTPAQVLRLPDSWFGIYYHEPTHYVDLPDRAFTMPVNRIDFNRTLILLQMHTHGQIQHGYVNFNCSDHTQFQTPEQRLELWQENCQIIRDWQGDRYHAMIEQLTHEMPFRNHDLEHDVACQSGGINVIIETYASDYNISFSEKIFQALVLPRPWIIFCGTHSVARLESMGFDVMRDVIDHGYDHLQMNDDKISFFVAANNKNWGGYLRESTDSSIKFYQHWYRHHVLPRAQQAAQHNLALLKRWRQQWWQDLPGFLHQLNCVLEK